MSMELSFVMVKVCLNIIMHLTQLTLLCSELLLWVDLIRFIRFLFFFSFSKFFLFYNITFPITNRASLSVSIELNYQLNGWIVVAFLWPQPLWFWTKPYYLVQLNTNSTQLNSTHLISSHPIQFHWNDSGKLPLACPSHHIFTLQWQWISNSTGLSFVSDWLTMTMLYSLLCYSRTLI